ncbi:hypothetical protein EXW39_27965 (plasmid) [Bacillus mycoides]|uniref:hypothetical protein n=1 Tax=Bacillus mycoides TaxID=1405 RepID=UPI001C03523F|nr:hypothetical protein [Bacillus mycoides]QWH63940.1 hypothetical protein EXW39_27965 [Bacillus mycoides]
MYTKIVKYERNRIGDLDKEYESFEVLKEIKATDNDLFENILKVDGKLYKPCSAYGEYIAVDEITINENPEITVRSENELQCPYCDGTDQDLHELESNKGETECIHCGSEIKYVINAVINSLGECLEVICHTGPVKLNEPIEL